MASQDITIVYNCLIIFVFSISTFTKDCRHQHSQRDLQPNAEVYGEQKALKKGLATLREAEEIRTTTAAFLRGVPASSSQFQRVNAPRFPSTAPLLGWHCQMGPMKSNEVQKPISYWIVTVLLVSHPALLSNSIRGVEASRNRSRIGTGTLPLIVPQVSFCESGMHCS